MPSQALLEIDALLDRIATPLARRFTGVFSAETVDRYVHESYTALHRTARITRTCPTPPTSRSRSCRRHRTDRCP